VNTTNYYIETIDFQIRKEVFKHQYRGSSYNAALFLIFAHNTSTVRINLRNECSAQNAGNGILGLQISNISWGTMLLHHCRNAPPLENLHPI
jgi:hypothetical protein